MQKMAVNTTLLDMNEMIRLSIVIVNHNAKDYLRQCLTSLYGFQSSLSFEIIVVDNKSHDGSCAMIRQDHPQVHLIENRENVGFARGNNIGIKESQGEYILLLNSDTKVVDNAIDKLVAFLDSRPDVAVVTSRLVYRNMTDQGVARMFPTPMNALFGRRSLLTRLFPNNKYSKRYMISRRNQSEEPFEVDWVSGACLMVRKKVIEDVGLLDERFFMYWEDADLCFRIKQKKWKIYCIPEAIVIHFEGKSSQKQKNSRMIIEFNKNVYRYYRKHHIKHVFGLRNLVAVLGLTARTLILLVANACRPSIVGSKKGVVTHERT